MTDSSTLKPNSAGAMLEVFISYSRRDKSFVQKLCAALRESNRSVWVDWEDIPPLANWRQEIYDGIVEANAFLFIISPDSVASCECKVEIEHAIKLNKRLVPIVYHNVEADKVHPALSALNWIFFEESNDFDTSFQTLLQAIDTDLDHVRTHTRLLVKAEEWQQKAKDESCLLRGNDLELLEQWAAEGINKNPQPNELQRDYLAASRSAENTYQRRERRRQRIALVSVSLGLMISTILGLITLSQYQKAEANRREAIAGQIKALSASSNAQFVVDQNFEALMDSLKAATMLLDADWVQGDTRLQALANLTQALYLVEERNRLEKHTDWVNSVSFSPDGQIIASASGDRTIIIWQPDGTWVKTLEGHRDGVLSVDFSSDGQILASSDLEGTIKLWRRDGTPITTLEGNGETIRSVSFSPNGEIFASGRNDGTMQLWRVDGTAIAPIAAHQDQIREVSFSPDGQVLASASDDTTIKLWQRDGTAIRTLQDTARVGSVNFSPDGQTIVSANFEGEVKLWRRDGTPLFTFAAHEESIRSVRFSPNGEAIATASTDQTIKLWRRDGTLITTLFGHTAPVRSLSFSPNGEILLSASDDDTIRLWQLNNPLGRVLEGHPEAVKQVRMNPSDESFGSFSEDGTIQFWRMDGDLSKTLQINGIRAIDFSPTDPVFVISRDDSTSEGGLVEVRHSEGEVFRTFRGHTSWINDVRFSPDGNLIASASNDKTVRLWNRDGDQGTILQHEGSVFTVDFNPNGELIVTASDDGQVYLWNTDGTPVSSFRGHEGSVYSARFSPDGQYIVSSGNDQTLRLWNLDGTPIAVLEGHTKVINEIGISPDGQMIASASDDQTIRVWRRDGSLITVLKGHQEGVTSVNFSPDGQTLISTSDDQTVILWNVQDLSLENLVTQGCNWLRDYLRTNPNVEERDRTLCP